MKLSAKDEVPKGYRGLGNMVRETEKAALFDYYGWQVWIPKKAVVQCKGSYFAPAWAIDSSKARQIG